MLPSSSNAARIGFLLALGATVGWSFNVLFASMLAGVVPPFTLILLRSLVALVFFTPFALKGFLREWPLVRARFLFYAVLALAGFGLFNAMIYLAGKTTSVINMALLNTTTPVFALLLGRAFFGEPLTPRRLFGIAAAVSGVVLLTARGDLTLLRGLSLQVGDAYMLGAAFLFACYTVGMRSKHPGISNNTMILATLIISAVFLLPISAWEIASGKPLAVTAASVTGVLYLGIVASILCYICWTGAITRIGPSNTALVYYTLPLFSGLEAVLIANEAPHWFHFASGALIIAGVIVATKTAGKGPGAASKDGFRRGYGP